jgi:hypothetical protein
MRSHRLLSASVLCVLTLTAITIPQAHSQSRDRSSLPYIYSNSTFPPYRATVARHTIRLAIPTDSQAVSALKLTAPAGFTLNRQVEVFDRLTGTKLPVDVNIDGQTVELSFDRAVAPGMAVNIELNNVNVWGLEKHYDLAAKFVSNKIDNNDNKSFKESSDRYTNIGRTELRRS